MLIFSKNYLLQTICLLQGWGGGGEVEMLFGQILFENAVTLQGASLMDM